MAKAPAMTEAAFQRQVLGLAKLRGWRWAHFKTARYGDNWLTAASGPLGKGWPDLCLVRESDQRFIFAELKRAGHKPSESQLLVLAYLSSAASGYVGGPRVEVYVWLPKDWDEIERVLR